MSIFWKKYTLNFKRPSGTSRGILKTKDSWFLVNQKSSDTPPRIGECSLISGLSPDPINLFNRTLDAICAEEKVDLTNFPAIQFGLETLKGIPHVSDSPEVSDFRNGNTQIPINGLIWMGNVDFMKSQIREKVNNGYSCIKIKIGAIDFDSELNLLSWIRKEYTQQELELRVDANGAFSATEALEKLNRLSDFNLHSIEQPIAPKQWEAMTYLCENSPIDIALDEELIGLDRTKLTQMMDAINPQYVILKPSLVGGIERSDWIIDQAEKRGIGWWLTSALESNIGLMSIAEFAAYKNVRMPQGLGTGSLYTNNIDSPLYIQGQFLAMNPDNSWNLNPIIQ